MTGDAIREAMGWAGSEGFYDTEAAGEEELKLLLDVVDAARMAALLLADFGRVAKWQAAGEDLGEPAASIRLKVALAALDGAA